MMTGRACPRGALHWRSATKKPGSLPSVADLPIRGILDAVKRDKKVVNSRLHFVLCTSVGTTDVVDDVTEDELTAALVRLGLPN